MSADQKLHPAVENGARCRFSRRGLIVWGTIGLLAIICFLQWRAFNAFSATSRRLTDAFEDAVANEPLRLQHALSLIQGSPTKTEYREGPRRVVTVTWHGPLQNYSVNINTGLAADPYVVMIDSISQTASSGENPVEPNTDDETADALVEALAEHDKHLLPALRSIANEIVVDDEGRVVELNLDYVKLTDEGLRLLCDLTDLQVLSLGGTRVTDDGLVHLQGFKQLTTLELYYSGIRGDGFKHLSELTHLDTLVVYGSKVTDSGLENLHTLTNLKGLVLSINSITDDALPQLSRLDGLVTLDLSGTEVTVEGVEQLRNELPNCVIYGP